jgi:8-oxo-dGTP diphosphatase
VARLRAWGHGGGFTHALATVASVASDRTLLARGPWDETRVLVRWRERPYEPDARATRAADAVLAELRARGSPSHDGYAAALVGWQTEGDRLVLDMQPARWSLRLLEEGAVGASASCVVRSADGRWLAGRRAPWLASWPGRWALGAAGAIEVGEHPLETMRRELAEEWSVQPQGLALEALVQLPSGALLLLGQAWLTEGAQVVPDAEHDGYAWWPRTVEQWPSEAHEALRLMARFVSEPSGAGTGSAGCGR